VPNHWSLPDVTVVDSLPRTDFDVVVHDDRIADADLVSNLTDWESVEVDFEDGKSPVYIGKVPFFPEL
jgi:hypothetical protein